MKNSRTTGTIDMNVVISDVLKYGVVISAVLVAAGVILLFLETPHPFPATVQQLVSTNYGKPTLSFSQLARGVGAGSPIYLIELGLIVLLATPVARVAASVLMFAAERDRMYAAITLFVLLVLIFGILVVGPLEAAAG